MSEVRYTGCLNPEAGIPRLGLPDNISYPVWSWKEHRLLKSERPPFGWYGAHSLRSTDYSDSRRWEATNYVQRRAVWTALEPTIKEYECITSEKLSQQHMRCIPDGYEATYDEIHRKLQAWVYEHLGTSHEWVKNGKLSKRLFKLERWYGTILDYMYAPNSPCLRREQRGQHLYLVQNPETKACDRCSQYDIFCYGHKENDRYVCTPCIHSRREDECSKKDTV